MLLHDEQPHTELLPTKVRCESAALWHALGLCSASCSSMQGQVYQELDLWSGKK